MFEPKQDDIINKQFLILKQCPICGSKIRKCNYELTKYIKYRCQNGNCLKQYFYPKNEN